MKRRVFFKAGIYSSVTALGVQSPELHAADIDLQRLPPMPGDVLVRDTPGAEPLLAASLEQDVEQVFVYPQDPSSGLIRSGSRFNKVMVIRLDPALMDAKTAAAATEEGIVAYSGICTHEGCDVNSWVADKKEFFCFCHYTRFDPYRAGKVTTGPARKRLPLLPVTVVDDQIVVAASFLSKPGKKR